MRVEVGRDFQHLQRDGALPGDNLRIVEGVDEDEAPFGFQLPRLHERVVDARPVQDDVGAMALGLRHLDGRRGHRHHDRHRDSEALSVIGDGLRMVAGGRRDHAALTLLGRQLQQAC